MIGPFGSRVLGIVDRNQLFDDTGGIIVDYELQWAQHRHPALGGLVQALADCVLEHCDADNAARNRKAESFVPARLRQNEGVHANHRAINVHKRPARISWIDRRIGLDVNHRRIRIGLPRNR